MGYNKATLNRVRERYKTKYLDARQACDERTWEAEAKIPELASVNKALRTTGPEVFAMMLNGQKNGSSLQSVRERKQELLKKRTDLLRRAGYPDNYLDVQYECPVCGDSGYVGIRMCECMKKTLVEEEYKSSGLGELLKTQSFDSFSLDYYKNSEEEHALMQSNLERVKQYAETFRRGESPNLLFYGATGLGKTHLCTSVAKQLIEKGQDVLYVTAVGMVADFEKQRFGGDAPESENGTERYYEADLLIIDDLGTEVINQFTASVIYNLINERINKRLPMIINTNLSNREIQQRYSDRIASRLFGECTVILFKGTDVRMQKIRKK